MRSRNIIAAVCVAMMIILCIPMGCMAEEDGQNPVMNVVGNYVYERAGIEIRAAGDDMAVITVRWSNSAFDHAEWNMSGVFDTETLTVTYSDCIKKIVSYDREAGEDEKEPEETIEYRNGTGSISFQENGTLTWIDEQEHIADDAVFEYVLTQEEITSFVSEMTSQVKYIMYVGTNDKDTYEPVYPYEEARELANNICAKYTGGYTQIDGMGGWLDDSGVLTQERTLIYIFFDADEEGLKNIMDELIAELHQSSILIEKQEAMYTFYSGE